MASMIFRIRTFGVLAVGAGLGLLAACHRSIPSVCRQQCECSPCTDFDLEECISTAEHAADKAAKAGCTDKFDALVGCYDDHVSCRDGTGPGTDKCQDEERLYRLCDPDLSNPFLSVCEEASAKTTECIGAPQPFQPCEGFTKCLAECFVKATCDQINGVDFGPFQECVNACSGVSPTGSGGAFDTGGPK